MSKEPATTPTAAKLVGVGPSFQKVKNPLVRKIIILIVAFVLPLTAVALFFLTRGPNKDIAFAAKEVIGDIYNRPLESLLEAVPRYRSLVASKQPVAEVNAEISRAFEELDAAQAAYGEELQFNAKSLEASKRSGADPRTLRSQWGLLQEQLAKAPDDPNTAALFNQFMDGVGNAIAHSGDKSNLILDPDLDAYYAMDVTLNVLPATSRRSADLISYLIANGASTADARLQLAIFAAKLADDAAAIDSKFTFIYAEDENFYGRSETLKPNTETLLKAYLEANQKLVSALKTETDAAQLIGLTNSLRTANSQLWESSVKELDTLLKMRIDALAGQRLQGLLLAFGLVALASIVAFFILRGITRPLAALTDTIGKVASGDETARAPVMSQDEIGQVAAAFNTMVAERSTARQRLEEENRRLQTNIQELLIAVADASDGNLAVRAKVTEGSLGNVADALNLMLENVGDLIKSAKDAARQVASSATRISQSTVELTSGSTLQAEHLTGASADVAELSAEAHAVSDACREATRAAEQASSAAERGAQIVRDVIQGMERIRESVQVNTKKIKRLGERSMEIGGILKTINEISAQTDMLALNASIEAGRAGEAGRGFSAVAEQVRALSERARTATQQVEKLVNDIQTETAEAVSQAEAQTQQVEAGAQRVGEAGEALTNIVQVSTQSRSYVAQISNTAELQARRTGLMLNSVKSAAEIAQTSQEKVGGARVTSEELAALAAKLDQQLSQFQVAGAR